MAYIAAFGSEDYSSEAIDEKVQRLFRPDASPDEQKEILVLLAHTGKVTSAKIIKQFLEKGNPDLRDWARLSLQECQLLIDDIWSGDEGMGMIMSGLGGEDNRLRYFLAVRSSSNTPYTGMDRTTITENFVAVCRKHNSILEDIQIQPNYVTVKVLVPVDVAVGVVIEDGISQCNQERKLLDENYYVTNVKIPTEAELQAFLKLT